MFRRDGSSAAATTHWTVRSLGDDGALFKREQESVLREARGLRVKAYVPSVHPRLKYILLTNGDGQTQKDRPVTVKRSAQALELF